MRFVVVVGALLACILGGWIKICIHLVGNDGVCLMLLLGSFSSQARLFSSRHCSLITRVFVSLAADC